MQITIQQIRSILKCGRTAVQAFLPRSILLFLAAGAAVTFSPWGVWGAEPEIVARVNGEPVTRGEFQRMLADPLVHSQILQELGEKDPGRKELERLTLRKLVHRHLLLQEASRRNLAVPEQELDQAITALRRRFNDLKSFGAWMQERGLDDRSLIEAIRTELLTTRIREALAEGVRLTGELVEEYYEAHKEELKTAGDVRLRIIAVKEKATAEQIRTALQKGENFGALARSRSLGLRAAQGGDTGWVDPRTLTSPLREAVGSMKAGQTRGPLQRGEEFLIVRVEGRRSPRAKSLAEARPEIERRLLAAKRQEAVQAWLTKQELTSNIEMLH